MSNKLALTYKDALVGSHSIAKVKDVALEIKSKRQIDALLELVSEEHDYPTPEAAVWTIRHALDHCKPHHKYIALKLTDEIHTIQRDSYLKNVLGTLKSLTLPEETYGVIADATLSFLANPTRSKAVHYYSLELMFTLCNAIPELTREFVLTVDELLPLSSEPFKRKYARYKKSLSN